MAPRFKKGGGNYRDTQSFVLFDVVINNKWLSRENVSDIAQKLSIDVVPVVGSGTLYQAIENARTGIKSIWGDFEAEGYVLRPKIELLDRNNNRIITKIKCKDFIK